MRKVFSTLCLLAFSIPFCLSAQSSSMGWRMATPSELRSVIPARAPVGSERIETEMRSASGVTDGKGKFIAGVVMITAGYSADGKYSHFFLSQVPLKINAFTLRPGQYAIGWRRDGDMLAVSFYEAATGKLMGTVNAKRDVSSRVSSFRITPPGDNPQMFIGRFAFGYHVMPN
ncbi:MAG TPA: hypothetical protein VHX63_01335 [Acidobacteriaceae bacterium]|nr:hypothetical protein [Acidobacteriaceae bacterium]